MVPGEITNLEVLQQFSVTSYQELVKSGWLATSNWLLPKLRIVTRLGP